LPAGYFPGPPDLAVEVVSPSDRAADVQQKVQAWLQHGAQLVWVVEPKSQTISIYRPDGSATVLQSSATLEGDPVLPGFRYDVRRLFA
jgi:Uma2 family endonuclease